MNTCGFWAHCAYHCDLPCDHDEWCPDYPPTWGLRPSPPCPRRQCHGRLSHSWLTHWFGWVRR